MKLRDLTDADLPFVTSTPLNETTGVKSMQGPVFSLSGKRTPLGKTGLSAFIGLSLILATLVFYWPIRQNGFVNFDDGKYVEFNPNVQAGVTLAGVKWAFTATHASNWHPLTWLSHMLDCELFGLNPGRHHLTSLAFHLANTLLVFALWRRMTKAQWRSAVVAALFALHPLHVESVAWISERKDVLSTFFFLLTLWAYARHARTLTGERLELAEKKSLARQLFRFPAFYCLAVLFFALGLMSKPMLVTLPFVLLLLDYWPLERCQPSAFRRLIWEKLPFFALSFASCAVTFVAQRKGGAVASLTTVSTDARFSNAVISYARYLGKMIWPVDLAVFYPYPKAWPVWQVATAALFLVVVTVSVIRVRQHARYWATGWFWYLGTLVPVIGLVQVGGQAMADRYTYIPLIGVFVAVVWGLADLAATTSFRRALLGTVTVMLLAVCGWLTHKQVELWRDSVRLFKHALAVVPPSALAHDSLGSALLARNEFSEAKIHYEAALKLLPNNPNALSNLGTILGREGKLEEAIRCFQTALNYDPQHAPAHYNWGFALLQAGQPAAAIVHYRATIQRDPDHVEALNGLAWLQATQRDPKIRNGVESIRLAQRAVELTSSSNAGFLDTLAAAHAEAGQFSDATRIARQALDLAVVTGDKTMAAQIQSRLNLYLARQPYRE